MILQELIKHQDITMSVIVDYDYLTNNVDSIISCLVVDEEANQIEIADILGMRLPNALDKIIDSIDWEKIYSFKYSENEAEL